MSLEITNIVYCPNEERWWGGAVSSGVNMPFGAEPFVLDLRGSCLTNQAAPLLISNQGRTIWSNEPFRVEFEPGRIKFTGTAPLEVSEPSGSLRGGYLEAMKQHFRFQPKAPPDVFFSNPQYNTWIELMYDQSESAILNYAQRLLEEGYPPGVLMIDDGWQQNYGEWRFATDRFRDPKAMVQKLQQMGFKVMLWVIPFVTADTPTFRRLRAQNALLRDGEGRVAVREWWNGFSALADVTGGAGRDWFVSELKRLQQEYGIDGFKFDGGDAELYRDADQASSGAGANGHCEAYARIGAEFEFNEYRAAWKCGGMPLVMRLRDKCHEWNESGLGAVVPDSLAQGMLGYAYSCPDQIGGGEYQSFLAHSSQLDPELFVRYAQCSALMPMMQFSAAPWRVLDQGNSTLCRDAALLHGQFAERILALARHALQTGEPIIRHLEYEFPHQGYTNVCDQFMLGSGTLVAPVLQKGVASRVVKIPPGQWQADDGQIFQGPAEVEIETPLERLPRFERLGGPA
jgi:alpha-glucosidase (family GH31 glycosyl hydrolase)